MSNDIFPDAPTPQAEPAALVISARTAGALLLFTLAFTALMAGIFSLTQPRLVASAKAERLRLIGEVLAADQYDNDLLGDAIGLAVNPALATEDGSLLYRARKNGQPVALIFDATAPDGYGGAIGLLVAVSAQGRLLAVRVSGHRETPGLGDYIDPRKDRNKQRPWISQFTNLGFADVAPAQWTVRRDGGHFDQMSGATISARAVTQASGRALAWAVPRLEPLFALPSGARFDAAPDPEVVP